MHIERKREIGREYLKKYVFKQKERRKIDRKEKKDKRIVKKRK